MPFPEGDTAKAKLRGVAFHHSVQAAVAEAYLRHLEPIVFEGPFALQCTLCKAEFVAYFSKEQGPGDVKHALRMLAKVADGCEKGSHPNTIVELY
jgi:hypothetical protein